MTKVLVIGCGEVGSAIAEIEDKCGNKVHIAELGHTPDLVEKNELELLDCIHVCIPYSKNFKKIVINYVNRYYAKLVIIHSTVKPGTTKEIADAVDIPVVHSFIRGVHPNLVEGIKTFRKSVGGESEAVDKAIKYLRTLNIPTHAIGSAEESEISKILSTTYYGFNIAFAKYVGKLCRENGYDYNEVYTWANKSYNIGYEKLDKKEVVRPVLTPPEEDGERGHCIVNNAVLLDEMYGGAIPKLVLDIGYYTEDKYKNRTWLYAEYIGKDRSVKQLAEECKVDEFEIVDKLIEFGILKKENDN